MSARDSETKEWCRITLQNLVVVDVTDDSSHIAGYIIELCLRTMPDFISWKSWECGEIISLRLPRKCSLVSHYRNQPPALWSISSNKWPDNAAIGQATRDNQLTVPRGVTTVLFPHVLAFGGGGAQLSVQAVASAERCVFDSLEFFFRDSQDLWILTVHSRRCVIAQATRGNRQWIWRNFAALSWATSINLSFQETAAKFRCHFRLCAPAAQLRSKRR